VSTAHTRENVSGWNITRNRLVSAVRLTKSRMNAWHAPALLLATALLGCGAPGEDNSLEELNVNSRYIVESVHVMGYRSVQLSPPLRSEINRVVGEKLDSSMLDKLADRIKRELRVPEVAVKIARGTEPERVIVNFEISARERRFNLSLSKFLYDSKQGWTGDGSATTVFRGNALTFGLLSDADSLVERFSGIRARFERREIASSRLGLAFEFSSFHEKWNMATLAAAAPSEIYRTRQTFTPEATLRLAQPLELSFGVSFARLQIPFSTGGAARAESSNAVVNSLRYHRRWGSEHDPTEQELTASYSLRTATGLLGSDTIFTRQIAQARYRLRHARHTLELGTLAGKIRRAAPLFERFVLGDSATLRGWNKFDLDPAGGSRMLHASADYGYAFMRVFYDAGAIWDRAQDRDTKQSAGVGFKVEGFQLAVAFPVRGGRPEPVFYAGMNF
jgi:hypothetical protein